MIFIVINGGQWWLIIIRIDDDWFSSQWLSMQRFENVILLTVHVKKVRVFKGWVRKYRMIRSTRYNFSIVFGSRRKVNHRYCQIFVWCNLFRDMLKALRAEPPGDNCGRSRSARLACYFWLFAGRHWPPRACDPYIQRSYCIMCDEMNIGNEKRDMGDKKKAILWQE